MGLSAEVIHDLAVQHRVGLSRFSTSVTFRVLALLNRMTDEIKDRLARTDNESVSGQRLEALLTELRAIQTAGWRLIADRVNADVADLADAESRFALRLAGIPDQPTVTAIFGPLPSLEQIVAAVNARPFQGRYLREWLSGAEANTAARVRDAVRQGFVEGRPVDEIVRIIRGTRAAQYRDGLMEISRRGAEGMVRTALTHTANVAAQATWEANSDVVQAWRFVATLDARTTLICAGLHGKVFPLGKGPQPPRHIACRSISIPVVAAIEGVASFELPTYNAWLRRQPVAVQEDILGVAKAKLFRDGGLKIDRFTDSRGRVLTLAELRRLDLEAFERAGL